MKTSVQCTATTCGGTQCKHKATMKLAGKDVCTMHGTLDERRAAAAVDPETKRLEAEWLEATLARAPVLDDETVYQIVRLLL